MVNLPSNWQTLTPTRPVTGSQTAPTANTVIADTGALPAGLYLVRVMGVYGATPDVLNNMHVLVNDAHYTFLPVQVAANGTGIWLYLDAVAVYEGRRIQVVNITSGAVGSIFIATIIATPLATLEAR